MNFKDIAILNNKGSDYWSVFSLISKNEAAKLLQNADFTEKSEMSSNIKIVKDILTFNNIKIEKY